MSHPFGQGFLRRVPKIAARLGCAACAAIMTHFQYIKNFHWQQEKSRKTASLGKAADKPRLNAKEPPKILPSPRLTCRIANFIGKVLENPPEIYEKSHYQKALKRGIIPVEAIDIDSLKKRSFQHEHQSWH